ncbi:unnamed protein product [Symbiodinium natans]|uniref:Uncharacterized protein n=1 Tax=Symbiodinium natans TaxID=878477 RepID=A0A812NI05_9DINO|nr:unnamed protein product [Symbiodinium natans]
MALLRLLLLAFYPLLASAVRPSSVSELASRRMQQVVALRSNASVLEEGHVTERDPGWKIALGPFTFCDTGFTVAPKFEIGVEVAGCGVMAGLGDVRDGISLFAGVHAKFIVDAVGRTWEEMFRNLRTNVHQLSEMTGVDAAIARAQQVIGPSGNENDEVVKLLQQNQARVNTSDLLKEHARADMEVKMKAATGIGISAKVCPGWKDADGFHNVGGGASLDIGVDLEFDLVVGWRPEPSPRKVRILLGLCNFFFQITFPIPD